MSKGLKVFMITMSILFLAIMGLQIYRLGYVNGEINSLIWCEKVVKGEGEI